MKGSKKIWLTGSVFFGIAALITALAIPLGASAKTTHTVTHCAATHDNIVDASQYATNNFTGEASGPKCSVTVSGRFTPGAIIKPVIVTSKVTVDATGGFTGQFGNSIFQGTMQGKLVNPKTTHPGVYKIRIHICIDIDPPSLIITIKF